MQVSEGLKGQAALEKLIEQLVDKQREVFYLSLSQGILSWDQQTQMPVAAAEARAKTQSILSTIVHKRLVDPQVGKLIDDIVDGKAFAHLSSWQRATVREGARQFKNATVLPESLVSQLSEAGSIGYQQWHKARQEKDFAIFAPQLRKTIELKRQEAQAAWTFGEG